MILKFGNKFINLDQACYAEIKPETDGKAQIEVVWADGESGTFSGGRVEDIEEQCGAIVPAAGGFKLKDQGNPEILPVVAFRVAAGSAIPVTPSGEPKSDTWSLLLPDGGSLDSAGTLTPAGRAKPPKLANVGG